MPFPTTEAMIAREETLLGLRLPASLRQYLLASNGGEVDLEDGEWRVFPVKDDVDRKRLARTTNHIVRETAEARSWSGFPPLGVAIASNGGGDFLVLMPESEDDAVAASAVQLWDHETGQLTRIADDWAEVTGQS